MAYAAARRALRHPRRRHRPEVPAPRERDRADRARDRRRRSRTYWMHNGFLNIDNEKMSKSLGNFFTIREVLDEQYAIRGAALLPAVEPLPRADQLLAGAARAGRCGARRLYTALRGVEPAATHEHRRGARERSGRRWTTTSTRRKRSRCCRRSRARSTARRPRAIGRGSALAAELRAARARARLLLRILQVPSSGCSVAGRACRQARAQPIATIERADRARRAARARRRT